MITVKKPKLAKHRSYVLKTSMLEDTLAEVSIDCQVDLVYWNPQLGGSILQAFYWLPNERVNHVRVFVRAGTVPALERNLVLPQFRDRVLPGFAHWLSRLLKQPLDSPALLREPKFEATWDGATVKLWEN